MVNLSGDSGFSEALFPMGKRVHAPHETEFIAHDDWPFAREYFRETELMHTMSNSGMVIRKSDVQIRTLADWRLYAAPRGGETQWRDYSSAKELARAWCPEGIGPTVPPETKALLESRPEFAGFQITEAIPEHRIRFDDLRGEPRSADLVAVGNAGGEEFVLAVEGKSDEPFGAYVGDELVASARRIAREVPTHSFERIHKLTQGIFRPRVGGEPHVGELRFQLLTAVAATLAFATEREAARAAFVVHEFRTHTTNESLLADNQRDLDRFIERLTNGRLTSVPVNQLLGPFRIPGNEFLSEKVEFFVGKVRRELLALD